MKLVIAAIVVLSLALGACGDGRTDRQRACEEYVAAMVRTYVECGAPPPDYIVSLDCTVYGPDYFDPYDFCSEEEAVARFRIYADAYFCDTSGATPMVRYDGATISPCF